MACSEIDSIPSYGYPFFFVCSKVLIPPEPQNRAHTMVVVHPKLGTFLMEMGVQVGPNDVPAKET